MPDNDALLDGAADDANALMSYITGGEVIRDTRQAAEYRAAAERLRDMASEGGGQGGDSINHPAHYTAYKGIEVIDLTEQLSFNRGNAVKYIARAGLKSADTEVEDLRKAAWYIQRELDRIGGGS